MYKSTPITKKAGSPLYLNETLVEGSKQTNKKFSSGDPFPTTIKEEDSIIYNKAIEWGFSASRGSELDVLDRFYKAVKNEKPHWVVRVTSDCPLIDSKHLYDKVHLPKDYFLILFFPKNLKLIELEHNS